MDRRDMLRGGAGLLAAGVQTSAAPRVDVPALSSGPITTIGDVGALARSRLPLGSVALVTEVGRGGMFLRAPGLPPVADPLGGLYMPVERGDGYFARIWDGRTGRPEWFGARTNDGRADCAPAIEACIVLCPVTELAQADYFIRRTLVIDRSWRTMHGSGNYAGDQGQGTRVILQGSAPGIHEADVVLVGSQQQPSRTNDGFPFEIHLSDFTLVRDGAVAPHSSGDLRRYPAGLRASFLTRCSFARIAALESSVGFYFGGTVYTKVDDCLGQRLSAGLHGAAGPDLGAHFFLDGRPDVGLAGGNASIYLNRCLAVGQHAGHVRPTGLIAEGAFVDSFIDRFESARVDNGMRFTALEANGLAQTVDLHVRYPVLDGCSGVGLEVDLAGTQTASVEILDPYVYASGSGGAAGLAVRDGGGLVTVTGGQVHGDFRNGSMLLRRTRGVRVQGLKLHEGSRPLIVEESGALQLEPQIANSSRRTGSFAVTCVGVYRSAIRPLVIGAPGMLGGGVSLDAACNYCGIDTSAVDPGCFGEVTATRKLWFGGADAARAPGSVSFAGRGNVVTGVLG